MPGKLFEFNPIRQTEVSIHGYGRRIAIQSVASEFHVYEYDVRSMSCIRGCDASKEQALENSIGESHPSQRRFHIQAG